jgi:hypothetical protein
MSEIITDKLTGKTSAGDVTITSEGGSATMQLQQGVAKAWNNFNGTGTIASRDSFSVSSISDNGTGSTTLTFSNAFNSADYVLNYTNGYGASVNFTTTAPTTTTALIQSYRTDSGASQDRTYNLVAVHGDLA